MCKSSKSLKKLFIQFESCAHCPGYWSDHIFKEVNKNGLIDFVQSWAIQLYLWRREKGVALHFWAYKMHMLKSFIGAVTMLHGRGKRSWFEVVTSTSLRLDLCFTSRNSQGFNQIKSLFWFFLKLCKNKRILHLQIWAADIIRMIDDTLENI